MKKMRNMLAVCGAVMMLTVPAFAGETDVTGKWYGDMVGAVMTLTLNEDGTYSVDLAGDVTEGTWEQTEEGIVMDGDELLTVTENGLETGDDDEVKIYFGREELENFVPAEIDYEADLDLLQGKWSAYKVGTNGAYLNLTPGDTSYMEMDIDGTDVTLSGFYFEEPVTFEMDNQDGGLFIHFNDESEMFELMAVNYLEDGTLRLALVVSVEDDDQVEYLFVPAEEAEEVTEAITE